MYLPQGTVVETGMSIIVAPENPIFIGPNETLTNNEGLFLENDTELVSITKEEFEFTLSDLQDIDFRLGVYQSCSFITIFKLFS